MKTDPTQFPRFRPLTIGRIRPVSPCTNPIHGRPLWSPVKSLWFTTHALIAMLAGWLTLSAGSVLLAFAFTVFTMCMGTIGLHRLLAHRSFECPRWLEYALVHLGTVAGLGGPYSMLYLHDIRDWAQRHPECHPFFSNQGPLWRDLLWQMHFEMRLDHPPAFLIESRVADDPVYRWMQRNWMWQQAPWALLFFVVGGIGWVVWGISVRIIVSAMGHFLVGYLAHNRGERAWHLKGHAVQGYNLPHLALITMGEAWHNNHHAFPGSARLGLNAGQFDPGWWVLRMFKAFGLVWNVKTPGDLPARAELLRISSTRSFKERASAFFAL